MYHMNVYIIWIVLLVINMIHDSVHIFRLLSSFDSFLFAISIFIEIQYFEAIARYEQKVCKLTPIAVRLIILRCGNFLIWFAWISLPIGRHSQISISPTSFFSNFFFFTFMIYTRCIYFYEGNGTERTRKKSYKPMLSVEKHEYVWNLERKIDSSWKGCL